MLGQREPYHPTAAWLHELELTSSEDSIWTSTYIESFLFLLSAWTFSFFVLSYFSLSMILDPIPNQPDIKYANITWCLLYFSLMLLFIYFFTVMGEESTVAKCIAQILGKAQREDSVRLGR